MAKLKPTTPEDGDSSAMKLIQLVWDHNRKGTSFSWERLNHSMSDSVRLAINAGLKFDIGDFTRIANTMRIGYWGGNDGEMCGERFYSLAVEMRHSSAYQSFESWKSRKPFIINGDRIFLGRKFNWQGKHVTCTSIADGEDPHVIACSYAWKGKQHKVERRFRITHADIRAAKKAREL